MGKSQESFAKNKYWALLQMCNFSGRFRQHIIEQGGAELYLEYSDWQKRTAEFKNRPKFVQKNRIKGKTSLNNFLLSGGKILGGAKKNELARLNKASGCPLCFFARGQTALLASQKVIAVVGSRRASEKGLFRSRKIAEEIVKQGGVVVSGGAEGIDFAAHQAALESGGKTIVVLGNALTEKDERPARILNLFAEYEWYILSITAYAANVETNARLFVARNRYIAALADAVILVEGSYKSGALHTAKFASKMDIPVYVIPGEPDDPNAAAANTLLSKGEALALIDVKKQLAEVFSGVNSGQTNQKKVKKKKKQVALKLSHSLKSTISNLFEAEIEIPAVKHPEIEASPILTLLFASKDGLQLDIIADRLEMPMRELTVQISLYEMEDKIVKRGSLLLLNSSAFRI